MRGWVLWIGLGLLLLVGCANTTMIPSGSPQYDRDNWECHAQSEGAQRRWPDFTRRNAMDRLYILCMKARGYKQEGD
jgi:hypothetical protein